MASGFMQRFNGKIMAKQLWVSKGGLVDPQTGVAGNMDYVQKIPIQAVAALTTGYTAFMPPGMTLMRASMYTTVAFTGATATIKLGTAALDASYVTAVSCASIGVINLTLLSAAAVNLLSIPTGNPNLFITITQTATTTAVGTGTLILEYA